MDKAVARGSRAEGPGDFRTQLTVCQRELAFRRAELRDLEENAEQEASRRQAEMESLRSSAKEAVDHARATTQALYEERRTALLALRAHREELQGLRSEVSASEAEVELARMMNAGQTRERQRIMALRAEVDEAHGRRTVLRQRRDAFEAAVARTREEINSEVELCSAQKQEGAELDAAMAGREREVAEYRASATDLHEELVEVVHRLKAGHEESLAERRQLEAEVERLELQALMNDAEEVEASHPYVHQPQTSAPTLPKKAHGHDQKSSSGSLFAAVTPVPFRSSSAHASVRRNFDYADDRPFRGLRGSGTPSGSKSLWRAPK